jgi:para-nitrobenzyl esterase
VTKNGLSGISFYNIPFAAPPIGNLRFASPVDPEPWESLDASVENPWVEKLLKTSCIADRLAPDRTCCVQNPITIEGSQFESNETSGTPLPAFNYTEACLTANIYLPPASATPHEEGWPIVFFFYGGAFQSGCKDIPLYNASRIVESGEVIYVVPNCGY